MTKIKHSPFLAVFSRYGKLLVSPDPTLKKGTFSSCRNSTAIYKSQSRSSHSPRFKVTSRQARSHLQIETPLLLPSNLKADTDQLSVILFKFKHSFTHIHPPICATNTAPWRTLSTEIWTRIRPLARPSFPRGLGPSEQTRRVMT